MFIIFADFDILMIGHYILKKHMRDHKVHYAVFTESLFMLCTKLITIWLLGSGRKKIISSDFRSSSIDREN